MDKECQTITWLDCDVELQSGKRMVTAVYAQGGEPYIAPWSVLLSAHVFSPSKHSDIHVCADQPASRPHMHVGCSALVTNVHDREKQYTRLGRRGQSSLTRRVRNHQTLPPKYCQIGNYNAMGVISRLQKMKRALGSHDSSAASAPEVKKSEEYHTPHSTNGR